MADTISAEMLSQVIQQTGFAEVQCAGASMEPTVTRGAKVTIERCVVPRAGDVVLFECGGELLLHRVLWYSRRLDRFAHAGDRPGAGAGIASGSNIIGRARLQRRRPTLSQQWSGVRRIAELVLSRARRGIG